MIFGWLLFGIRRVKKLYIRLYSISKNWPDSTGFLLDFFLFYNTGRIVDKSYTDCMVSLILQIFPFHVSKPPASFGRWLCSHHPVQLPVNDWLCANLFVCITKTDWLSSKLVFMEIDWRGGIIEGSGSVFVATDTLGSWGWWSCRRAPGWLKTQVLMGTFTTGLPAASWAMSSSEAQQKIK